MNNPNGLYIRFRLWLARKLDVGPDAGEGWCLNCAINGGKTLITSADGIMNHVRLDHHGATVTARTSVPVCNDEDPDEWV
jgi:hypothetical protein